MKLSRRTAIAALGGALLLSTTACSGTQEPGAASSPTEATTAETSAFPVRITHVYGETVVESQPQRVATISWVNSDILLALGVVPVGMDRDTYGNTEDGSTAWKNSKLEELGAPIGSENAPVLFDATNGINFDAIAEATPDLIAAAYSGLTQEEYDKLSKIAPVVGPGVESYQTPWQQSTQMIGDALGKSDEASQLITATEDLVAASGVTAHPEFAEFTAIAGNLDVAVGGINIYGPGDNRSRFLDMLGIPLAPFVPENAPKDQFFFNWSTERANEIESDIFFTWLPAGTTEKDVAADALLGQIPAVKKGGLVVIADEADVLAISALSPLSVPYALDRIVPLFVDATARVAQG
ncbi:ABC transporter substrate-binding protein [Tessaracoccus antarcticus]|uniref:ABC transporter substrate-binding protein n=1 Tax=Tessaracoccus antarcticus TaxID=2479848 RepID=A0A3M0FZL5_9ACTN|nr:ABC transporter substrate-binding protein [Tessaracoccus antarcticus]RMB58171.1 ABC transporter substrate-binding protein [Tessaracoccus antarcticus]